MFDNTYLYPKTEYEKLQASLLKLHERLRNKYKPTVVIPACSRRDCKEVSGSGAKNCGKQGCKVVSRRR